MHAISPDMRKAALIRQDLGRPHVPNRLQNGRNCLMMTQPAANSTPLSAGEMELIQATAYVWRARGYARTADNLLLVAGLASTGARSTVTTQQATTGGNVFDLSAYRARRQAVTR